MVGEPGTQIKNTPEKHTPSSALMRTCGTTITETIRQIEQPQEQHFHFNLDNYTVWLQPNENENLFLAGQRNV